MSSGADVTVEFGSWLRGMLAALRGDAESDVPCGTCTACCRSAQFVHIGPDETDTLAHVPAELLFAAPKMPPGHRLLGYDENGCCPMLGEGGCSIYEHRPRTCRVYDCRVFAVTGVRPEDKPLVAERVRQWQVTAEDAAAAAAHDAVRAAARFLDAHPDLLPASAPAAQRAVVAIEIHDLFVGPEPDVGVVRSRLDRLRD